jgi:large subunit ribosomal protein L2
MLKLYRFIFQKFEKSFSLGFVLAGGRNFLGRICVQHRGGGNKTKFMKTDRYRYINQFGFVFRILRDYYRTGFIGLIFYDNGLSSFILLSEGLVKGSRVFSGGLKLYDGSLKLGSTQKLFNINLFETINSIELYPFSGAVLAKAAGTSSKIISKNNAASLLKLTSGWVIKLANSSLATFGVVSNVASAYITIRKAGINRYKGIRPTVRGVIKNPCDHPHGGGEGKGSPPVAQVSP